MQDCRIAWRRSPSQSCLLGQLCPPEWSCSDRNLYEMKWNYLFHSLFFGKNDDGLNWAKQRVGTGQWGAKWAIELAINRFKKSRGSLRLDHRGALKRKVTCKASIVWKMDKVDFYDKAVYLCIGLRECLMFLNLLMDKTLFCIIYISYIWVKGWL